MDFLAKHIEALIFCSKQPISTKEIKDCMKEMMNTDIPISDLKIALNTLIEKYDHDDYAFHIVNINNGFQFLTKAAYQESISILLKQKSKKRLSNSALETLSIIAYKQPITKSEIEIIRGVASDYAVQKLLEKELIAIKGKAEKIGRPLLYGTSDYFYEYFGINSEKDLPTLKDFKKDDENEIGETSEI